MTNIENERLARVEEKTRNIEKKVDGVDVKVDILDVKFDTILEKLDQRFASKWVEIVVGGMIGLILTGFVGVLVALVFKTPTTSTTNIETSQK